MWSATDHEPGFPLYSHIADHILADNGRDVQEFLFFVGTRLPAQNHSRLRLWDLLCDLLIVYFRMT